MLDRQCAQLETVSPTAVSTERRDKYLQYARDSYYREDATRWEKKSIEAAREGSIEELSLSPIEVAAVESRNVNH